MPQSNEEVGAQISFGSLISNYNSMVRLVNENFELKDALLNARNQIVDLQEQLKEKDTANGTSTSGKR